MSYILDALQRADAERARGGVPTLNARPIASPPVQSGLNALQRVAIAIAVVSVLGAAAAAWWWVATVPAPQPVVATAPAIQVAPSPQIPVPAQVPASTQPVAQAPLPQTAAVPAAPVAPSAPTRQPVVKPPAPAQVVEPPAPTPPKPKTVAVAPLLAELPEATRREIPTLAISGAVASDNPAQRLLLVNGQVLNQGSQVAPDLTVVEIRSDVSEFSFRGTRFRVTH